MDVVIVAIGVVATDVVVVFLLWLLFPVAAMDVVMNECCIRCNDVVLSVVVKVGIPVIATDFVMSVCHICSNCCCSYGCYSWCCN